MGRAGADETGASPTLSACGDRLGTAFDLSDERGSEAGPFDFAVLRRAVEFALGQFVDRNPHSDPGLAQAIDPTRPRNLPAPPYTVSTQSAQASRIAFGP